MDVAVAGGEKKGLLVALAAAARTLLVRPSESVEFFTVERCLWVMAAHCVDASTGHLITG